jgi:hypothetical protein
VKKYASGEKQAAYLRPVFEAAVAATELAARLAIKAFAEMSDAKGRVGASAPTRVDERFDREEIIGQVKNWLSLNLKDRLTICDPEFRSEDLALIHIVRSVNSTCRIELVSNRPTVSPPDGNDWTDYYLGKWNELSAQSPPLTRITMIRDLISGECPFRVYCLVSNGVGLDLGVTFAKLGSSEAPAPRSLSSSEVDDIETMVDEVVMGPLREWRGRSVRIVSFNLA